jgi:hypothetical protein
MSPPFVSPWAFHPEQTGTQSADGAFALEYVEIANLHVHGYYAMRWPTPGPPTVEARIARGASQPSAGGGVATPAPVWAHVVPPATVQSFGRLGGLEIGVIDVPLLNQAGQVLTLVMTPPGALAPTWTLTPLEQVRPEPHARSKMGLGGDTSTFPEIGVGAFLGYPGNRHSGYFALAQPTSPTSYLPSVFFVSDYDGTVARLTEAEFSVGTTGSTAPVKAYVPTPTHSPARGPAGVRPQNPTQALQPRPAQGLPPSTK